MALTLEISDLLARPYRWAGSKSSHQIHLPFTPFYQNIATTVEGVSRGFSGNDFFLQNRATNEVEEDLPSHPGNTRFVSDETICGFAAYRGKDIERHQDEGDTTGSALRSYSFVTTPGSESVTISTAVSGEPEAIGLTHTRTATVRYTGNPYVTTGNFSWSKTTLTNEVNKAWLSAQLDLWKGEGAAFRVATGSGAGMYSYGGHAAIKTEIDGFYATVAGGHFRAKSSLFSTIRPSPADSEAALWNNNHSAWVRRVTRKLSPIVYQVGDDTSLTAFSRTEGLSIFKSGYAEEILSVPVSNKWRDDYGVFADADPDILTDAPSVATESDYLNFLPDFIGDGKGHEITFVSRYGDVLRITLEFVSPDDPMAPVERVVTLVTNEESKRVTHTIAPFPLEGFRRLRVSLIEKKDSAGAWQTVGDDGSGSLPAAPTLIADYPSEESILVFAIVKKRSGEEWGFVELTAPFTARYCKKTFKKHLTCGTVDVKAGACGDGGFSGSLDLEFVDQYSESTGMMMPRADVEFSMKINGTDWTFETYSGIDSVGGAGSVTTDTATHYRIDLPSGTQWSGRYQVSFDGPDNRGQIIDESWEKFPVYWDGAKNRTDLADYGTATAGQAIFYGGHRLTPA